MFKDYYTILDISIDAKSINIKKSYKALALKWHPDRNPSIDTTQIMQDINAVSYTHLDVYKRQELLSH